MALNCIVIKSPGTLGASPLGQRNGLWSPHQNLTSPAVDWAAGVGLSTTAGSVDTWIDRVAAKPMIGATEAKPTLGAAMNGIQPVRFTGGTYFTTPSISIAADRLYYFMLNITTMTAGVRQQLFSDNDGSPGIILNTVGDYFQIYLSNTEILTTGSSLGTGNKLVVIFKDSADGLYKLRINGVQIATVADVVALPDFSPSRFGQYPPGTYPLLDTSVAHFGMAGGSRSLTEVLKLEGYLAQRYVGTTFLPEGHTYRSLAPRRLN